MGIGRWQRAVRTLNHTFGLRDCPDRVPMVFADQREIFAAQRSPACMRYDLGTCPAPCAGGCSRRQYAERVTAVRRFLRGRNDGILDNMRRQMLAAASARQFERAASLRDSCNALADLRNQLRNVDDAQKLYSFIYPVSSRGRTRRWYLIHQGEVRGAVAAPAGRRRSNIRCLRLLRSVYGEKPGWPAPDDLDTLLITVRWFRLHPAELHRTISPSHAIAACLQESYSVEQSSVSD
jgi:excinuclease ABC subunit C